MKSGLIRTVAWNEAILVKAIVATVDRRNLMRIGLGHEASDLCLPNQKQ